MGRRRKIFTQREYNKLKKTSEGRQKIYLTYFFVAVLVFITCLIVGIFHSRSEYLEDLSSFAFVGAGISAIVGIIFLILFFVERSLILDDTQSEQTVTTGNALNDLNDSQTKPQGAPAYLIEQQRALEYIEKNEGIETDEGEHYYKLAMCYFKLQKACYRPMMIANLEKYLTSKPYTEIYENYRVGEYNSQFSPQPKRQNEYELSERNFLREIYFFLGRAYEQEGDGRKAIYYLDLAMGIIPEGAEHFIIELFLSCKKANDLPLFLKYCEKLPQTETVNEYRKQAKDLIAKGYIYKPRKKNNQFIKG